MARKFKTRPPTDIENIVRACLRHIGVTDLKNNQIALLTRLIFSGIASYFFYEPDNLINMGFIQFKKNPEKEQLFAINILNSPRDGVFNAETLCKYYKGELKLESELMKTLEEFVKDLLQYSQDQEENITELTRKLH